MKRFVDPFDYAKEILSAVKAGVTITAKADGIVNPMAIAWGTMGVEWNKPIFITFVRGCRFTESLLQKNPEFTVNIPLGTADRNIIKVCGTKSGRDIDKVKELGLTLEEPAQISVPGFKEFPLTLECRVVYDQQQYPNHVRDDHIFTHYDPDRKDIHGDYHTAFYGEIVSAYIIE